MRRRSGPGEAADARPFRVLVAGEQRMWADAVGHVVANRCPEAEVRVTTVDGLGGLGDWQASVTLLQASGDEKRTRSTLGLVRGMAPEAAVVVVADRQATGRPRSSPATWPTATVATHVPPDDLVAIVRQAQHDPGSLAGRRTGRARAGRRSSPYGLTRRELTVLGLLAGGDTTHTIAEVLAVSPNTVRTHVRNLMAKLGAQTRLAAVATARRDGLIDQPGVAFDTGRAS